ncbi:hypothetical protein U5B43_07375 [Campylobacter sp. 9BO]|uniref:hypothetical protein n=1 Tax=Campylobacter sp. 9BO TaxID=3424759 RepID=UPI003D3322FB
MNTPTINNHQIVVAAISQNLTPSKAIAQLGHDLREPNQTKNIGYLRDSIKLNRYYLINQFGNLIDRGNETTNHHTIENIINEKYSLFKNDYES